MNIVIVTVIAFVLSGMQGIVINQLFDVSVLAPNIVLLSVLAAVFVWRFERSFPLVLASGIAYDVLLSDRFGVATMVLIVAAVGMTLVLRATFVSSKTIPIIAVIYAIIITMILHYVLAISSFGWDVDVWRHCAISREVWYMIWNIVMLVCFVAIFRRFSLGKQRQ
jgi:cell shape-determining protein MreD